MDVTEWLQGGDPAIAWQVHRDLLGDPATAAVERARVADEGWGAQLLALQDERGYWHDAIYGKHGDRRSVMWSLQTLLRFGLDPAAPAAHRAIERVRDGVVWHEWGGRPFFHGEVEECVNGGVLAAAAGFGELGPGSDRIIGVLLDDQLPDGGWNCEPREESERSSFDSTLCVLEGLLAYEQAAGAPGFSPELAPAVAAARARGEEYLLERTLFRRRSTGEIVQPGYANFAFPPYWFYDVLRALDHFRAAGTAPDPRIAPAIDLLTAQRTADGRWLAGRPREGEVYFAVDAPEGEPSRWNTLRALRVLRWFDGGATRARPAA